MQYYTQTCSPDICRLVHNLGNILGSVQVELELAFEDELALEGHGVFLPMYHG